MAVVTNSRRAGDTEASSVPDALATLSELLRMGEIITSSLDIKHTYEEFAEHFRRLVPFDRLDIVLVDTEIGTYTDAHVIDQDRPRYRAGEVHELKGSLVGDIARGRRSIILNGVLDASSQHSGSGATFPDRFPSLLGVPLIWNDEAVGVLLARATEVNRYDEDHRVAALGASNLIASAIANSRRFETAAALADEREMRLCLNAENDALAEAIRQRDEFVIEASHALKTPLASVVACADLLLAGQDISPDQRELTEMIQRNSSILNDLIMDLGDLTGLDAGLLLVSIAPVLVFEIMDEVAQRYVVALQARRQDLAQMPVGDDVVVYGDRRRLGQALANLLSNASKFSDEGTKIHLDCVVDDGLVRITVRDHGIGIPNDEIGKVFDPFFRGAGAKVRARPGTGTGLFIAKKLMEYQGGTVSLASEPGVGTAVTITLPRYQPDEPRSDRSPTTAGRTA